MWGVWRFLVSHEGGRVEKTRSHNPSTERGKGTAEPNTAIIVFPRLLFRTPFNFEA